MKMMSRTRVTSTRGVTLIPVISSWSSLKLAAMAGLLGRVRGGERGPVGAARAGDGLGAHLVLLQVRGQGVGERLGAGHRGLEPAVEVVEGDHRRDGDEDADGGRDERLGEAGH